ncbi:hypothetical protein [Synechococcus sp. KORDI-52]|uniref:hypothetical protein n=1 Tax=Synechococcus sp. KORDI-52 TaxID=585425 RepID=UPI0020A69B2E|nr:hypothetical protein [Synechococcus sp. KORDI-52]
MRQQRLVTPHATAASATEQTNPQALIHIADQQSAPAEPNNPQKLQPLPNHCGKEQLIQSISPVDVCLATQKHKSVTNQTKHGPDELIYCICQTDSLSDRFAIPGHPSF